MCFNIFRVTCVPEEALVIRGVGCLAGSGPRYVVGGTAFVLPFLETFERLPLSKMRLEVKTRKVFTARGVPISVVGIAEVRVHWTSQEGLEGKSIDDIGHACLGVIEQHQMEVLVEMTPEMIFIN
jgi:flotillin